MKNPAKCITYTIALVLLVIIVAIIVGVCIVSCKPVRSMAEEMYSKYTDIASNASFVKDDKNVKKFALAGKGGEKKHIDIDLGAKKDFNTIALTENTKNVTMFNIYATNIDPATKQKEAYSLIYQGDSIEDFRICFLGNVSYRYLRVEVCTSTGAYNVNSIKVYNNKNTKSHKRVVTYFHLGRIEDADFNALETVTDIVIFDLASFDKKGHIAINEDNKAQLPVLKEKVQAVENAQHRKINLFSTLLLPKDDNDPNMYARYIMDPSRSKRVAKEINEYLVAHDLDGVDLDYEYPETNKEHKLFDSFLIDIDKAIGKKLLSIAVGAWNVKMSKEAIAVVDQFQLMTYDIFDSHRYHAAFNSCMVTDLHKVIKKGVPQNKINLGLPFYSRPFSGAGYWGEYKYLFSGPLNKNYSHVKYLNTIPALPCEDMFGWPLNEEQSFNGFQMIQDKMAFAIDTPVSGIMIWHMTCDLPYSDELSLFRAIHETIVAKSANLNANMK